MTIFNLISANESPENISPKTVYTQESLEEVVTALKPEENIWVIVPLSDSYENSALRPLALSSSVLEWNPPSFEECVALVQKYPTLVIDHLELQRQLLRPFPCIGQWIEKHVPLHSERQKILQLLENQSSLELHNYRQLLIHFRCVDQTLEQCLSSFRGRVERYCQKENFLPK